MMLDIEPNYVVDKKLSNQQRLRLVGVSAEALALSEARAHERRREATRGDEPPAEPSVWVALHNLANRYRDDYKCFLGPT
jgi:hypothetical protein